MHAFFRGLCCLLVSALAAGAISVAGGSGAQAAALTVQPLEGAPIQFTDEELRGLPHSKVTTTEHGGEQATFEGVPVAEILRRSGAPLGGEMRGESLRFYVVAKAFDGYEVVFALAEFDPAFSNREILIADSRNGAPLGAKDGPLRFVVPGDKRQARWIRNLQTITIYRHTEQ